MDDHPKMPDILTLLVTDPVLRADKQAKILQRFSLIADRICPRLSLSGSNFNAWSWNLFDTCMDRPLYELIIAWLTMPNARTVYQAIKRRFRRASWSSIIHHAKLIFNPTNHQHDLTQHAINMGGAIEAIESQLGPLDSSKISTLSLFFSLPHLHDQINSALDTRLAANPELTVNTEDILDIVQQLHGRSTPADNEGSIHLSKIDLSPAKPRLSQPYDPPNHTPKPYRSIQSPSQVPPISSRSEEWKKRWLTPQNPCFYCGEAGHWAPECPARKKASSARVSSQQKANVASIGAVLALEYDEALLDSGATHSVIGDASLFTALWKANITLSVASSHQFPVDYVGNVALKTWEGTWKIKNVLLCEAIKGVVLSIGQLISQGLIVRLLNNVMNVQQNQILFHTKSANFRWFIPFLHPSPPAIINCVSDSTPPPPINLSTRPDHRSAHDMSELWHRRMGHLSIRNIKWIMQFKAADGIPLFNADNIKICHPCSIAKAEHRPFISASRKHVHQPGNVIADDLIGPLPISIDGKWYALVIQDVFSRLTAVIALTDKSEAKYQLRLWMIKFMNVTKFDIMTIRTNNGAEFCNHFFNDFLKEKGIIHELSVPYEHHQNGQIKRTNRTLSEIAKTSLIAANLPTSLWPYAFRHAAWIFNRPLHSNSKITPYEIVGSRKPSLVQLRVFGVKAFIFNHQEKKDLGAKSFIGYHIGIMEDSKGWLFWIPERGTIVISASVKFNKDSYFNQKSPTHHTVSKIQVDNLFDGSMIGQLNKQDYFISALNSSSDPTAALPMTYDEEMSSLQASDWKREIKEELHSMNEQQVFGTSSIGEALRETPRNSILSTKWVFAKKGSPEHFKGWLVARGFRQIHGINFEETFAPTPTFGAHRLLFSIACKKKWKVCTFDVKVAFLHSLIDKPVYVWPPKGMNQPKYTVLKLKKALYGTKQAARCWWLHLKGILQKIGFKSSGKDQSTYFYDSAKGQAMLWIHVDDGELAGSSNSVINFTCSELDQHLQIKWDKEITGLVGLSIKQTDNEFDLNQSTLIDKLTSLLASKITANFPLPLNCNLLSNTSKEMDREYLKRIGMLLYIAQGTRPDISYAVNYLARFSMGTTSAHWEALEPLISYLRETRNSNLRISKDEKPNALQCYIDANWGGEGNRSTHGFIILHGGNPIAWQSK
ncbi:hypothetical protein O181_071852 [Austropuccinia psidii MF-1]|uniref:Gag-Pol-p199 n=1 Tax=Austropuccinia psidii MF-1 TaxID=1389203 RepID=A0A9Q3I9K4_9BASI|nr:hypothetical protein [Austropuccinia psidii MF-1]